MSFICVTCLLCYPICTVRRRIKNQRTICMEKENLLQDNRMKMKLVLCFVPLTLLCADTRVGGQYQQTCHSTKKWSSNYFQTCHNEDNLRRCRHVDLFPLAFLMNECIFLRSAVCNQRPDNGRPGGGIYH